VFHDFEQLLIYLARTFVLAVKSQIGTAPQARFSIAPDFVGARAAAQIRCACLPLFNWLDCSCFERRRGLPRCCCCLLPCCSLVLLPKLRLPSAAVLCRRSLVRSRLPSAPMPAAVCWLCSAGQRCRLPSCRLRRRQLRLACQVAAEDEGVSAVG